MLRSVQIFFCLVLTNFAWGQFAPQAGLVGTTAIPHSSPLIKSWATQCEIKRGYQDINQPNLGVVGGGDSSMAIGPSDAFVISLGDSGVATLRFSQPIVDGTGFDFAVFENGFINPNNLEEAYLELAFVEVSTDGQKFVRFPAVSNTSLESQIPGFGVYMNARLIHNLAGKYANGYGTPFDLNELKDSLGLDINNVNYVRIVDVVGTIGNQSSLDKNGNKINDPYPTAFFTGGFDLDAVAVLNQTTSIPSIVHSNEISIFPNPAENYIQLSNWDKNEILIKDFLGRIYEVQAIQNSNIVSVNSLQSGMYIVQFNNEKGQKCWGRFSKM